LVEIEELAVQAELSEVKAVRHLGSAERSSSSPLVPLRSSTRAFGL
jgi:hypothetical protein